MAQESTERGGRSVILTDNTNSVEFIRHQNGRTGYIWAWSEPDANGQRKMLNIGLTPANIETLRKLFN